MAAFVPEPAVPCFHPLDAYPGGPGQPRVVFNPLRSYAGSQAFKLPCGQCIGCRITRARDWATRMHHEAAMHDESSFVTLTYSDQYLPEDGSISRRATQLFFKRLRYETGARIKYFMAGEYGDATGRPHYHAIIFGYGFPDRYLWRQAPSGSSLFRSPLLEKVWPYGNAEIGNVTHQSAGYVARYCLKKINGERAAEYYQRPHPLTGEVYQVLPEFALMSKGIGGRWFEAYQQDAFPSDFVIVDGQKRSVPAYYKKKLTELEQLKVKSKRMVRIRADAANNTPARLSTREELQQLRAGLLKRELE